MDFAHEMGGGGPVDAAIGNTDAVAKLVLGLGERLATGAEVALDHRTHDGRVAGGNLDEEVSHDVGLALWMFRGVIVRAVDEDGFRETSLG